MNFLRLNDYLLSALYEDDEILAIDKPYGLNSHTNDSKIGNTDFIQDGLIEIYERQFQIKLHIVHRLDQTTTGVMIFAKSQEAAKKYADFFLNRQVKKTYWFITTGKILKNNFIIEKPILHKAKEFEAKTEFNLLNNSGGFSLWEAKPFTGRNHQIRIHAQAAEISILGDEKYEGTKFPFLCLHNRKIEFPNGVVLNSQPPIYFENLVLLNNQILVKALFEVDRRTRLFSHPHLAEQCFRLVHNKNDFKDFGFTIDQFGKVLVLSCYQENWLDEDQKTFSIVSKFLKKPILVRLMHNRGKDPLNKSQILISTQSQSQSESGSSSEPEDFKSSWVAFENNIKYEMRSDSGQSIGLFLDQRLQRNWVLKNSDQKQVLNLFSYTCGFSVAAALGGASLVTSIDTNKNVLNWGRKNFELNDIDCSQHKFLVRDSLDFLENSFKKNLKYDLIICDPPSFSRGEKGVFKIESSLELLLKNCLGCLNENGVLLFSTNFENFYIDDIRKSILNVKNNLKTKYSLDKFEINSIYPGLDFELPGKKSILKSFLIRT